MASMQDGVNFTAPPYSKVLLLGAIAATSAFVVTILIVLLCVGCQRKGKSNNVPGEGTKHRIIEMSRLRQSKLRSISKSDTKLHQMNQPNCNGKKSSKSRPASMDLLLLPSRRRRSHTDQRGPSSRQLPQIPSGGTGEDREHTYSEVGRGGSPQRCCPDDSLYEMVGGRAGETDTPAPPPPANTPAPHSPEHEEDQGGACEGPMGPQTIPAAPDPGAEYACVRKVRKVDKSTGKHGGAEPCERDLHQAPPPPIPHPHSQKIPRKIIEPFHLHAFPKEAVFMGNGEEYIWKPPEDDDLMFYPKPPCPMNPPITEGSGPQVPPAGVSELYSKVCKPPKKKRPVPGSPPSGKDNNGHRTLGREGGSAGFSVVVKPQSWGGGAQLDARGGATHGHASEDHCYEAIGEKAWPGGGAAEEGEPGYEGVDGHWRRERPPNATLKPRKKKPSQQHLPSDALYDSISDVRQAGSSSSTTTIFTFNDGMEMYVTGL